MLEKILLTYFTLPLDKWEDWNEKISSFYKSDDMKDIKQWTYDNGVQGINSNDIEHIRKNKPKN